ncbi:MAG: malto-oligosyltrehalose synthase, partial [Rhodanobacter sp.]
MSPRTRLGTSPETVPSPPRALGRLQFHAGFTLDDAIPVVGYYAALGISHLYASPILAARPGSAHGYDVIDCSRINPELGGEPALRRLVQCLREHGMGLILDIVPNHMYAGAGNAWWMDVLRQGRASAFAGHFDIDWQSPDPLVRGRVLLPILGDTYAASLQCGNVRLAFDAMGREFVLAVHDAHLPLSPETQEQLQYAALEVVLRAYDVADPVGHERLHTLIERQHYRLVLWKLASDLVNYRRFFDINELAGVRVERTRVFEASHALIFRLYAQGLIDGLRVDHVDGLADPHRYCRQLRHRLRRLQHERPPQAPGGPAYIVVEKILAEGERLRPGWQVDGTTGYDFMEQVAGVLHNATGASMLDELWRSICGNDGDFAAYARLAREQILVDSFEAERDRTSRALFDAARSALQTRDVSLAAIRRVLVQLLVWFPVYRTYAGGLGRDAIDEAVFQRAAAQAARHVRLEDRALLGDMATWLGGQAPRQLPPGRVRKARERALRIFQQATSPMAAKAVEDTACYRYGRLLSRNEVGADPGRLAIDADDFHAACAERAREWPHALLATATHDHKRGEDARMRLAVLSDIAPQWARCVDRWRLVHASLCTEVDGRRAPSPADEYMLYQSIVGAWPLALEPDDAAGLERLGARLAQWQQKALREAKHRSRWTQPNEAYEDACASFLSALLVAGSAPSRGLHAFVQRIAAAGVANSLAQTVLKLTVPGVPDIYQG